MAGNCGWRDTTVATRRQILEQQKQKALQKAEQAAKRAKEIEKLIAKSDRTRENRRKYIVGGYLLRALEEGKAPCQTFEELIHILNISLVTDRDREVFDLPKLAKKPKRARRKKKAATITVEASDTGTAKTITTTLPTSLIEATVSPPAVIHTDVPVHDVANDQEDREENIPLPHPHVLPEASDQSVAQHFNL
ncbi:hypothetical protein N836_00355 [Leptolyngbya sp. Heron Island J]|nr:hypothetical protein N836_00355 [Leptolyngbya sp. Heron Island J]